MRLPEQEPEPQPTWIAIHVSEGKVQFELFHDEESARDYGREQVKHCSHVYVSRIAYTRSVELMPLEP